MANVYTRIKDAAGMAREEDKHILSMMPEGSQATVDEILGVFGGRLTKAYGDAAREALEGALRRGLRRGIVARRRGCSAPLSFNALPTVEWWRKQLRGSSYEHGVRNNSTREQYMLRLYDFSKWLKGRVFLIQTLQQDAKGLKSVAVEESFANCEELLMKFNDQLVDDKSAVTVIIDFLSDDMHKGKSPSYMLLYKAAILSYFKHNQHPLRIFFDPRKNHRSVNYEQSMPITDIMKMLTSGRPSVREKAVFICKWHRGLDASTLVDRFNYEGLPQLVRYFGTDRCQEWDLDKCPAPVVLTRIKTGYRHTGFLDRDAISAIQDYLRVRGTVKEGEPLFVNKRGQAITTRWLYQSFRSLCDKAGLTECITVNGRKIFRADSHELRDTLKSTLISAGCRPDAANHVIGHKPTDSYEKQVEQFPEKLRSEYTKASPQLNLFTRFAGVLDEEDTGALKQELKIALKELDITREQHEEEKREIVALKAQLEATQKRLHRLETADKTVQDPIVTLLDERVRALERERGGGRNKR